MTALERKFLIGCTLTVVGMFLADLFLHLIPQALQ